MLLNPYRFAVEAGGGTGLLAGLVSYWKMDEASGDALDAHGTNHLTDTNTVGSAAGKIAGARAFVRANNEYFTRISGTDLSAGDIDFTIAAWVYPTNSGVYSTICGKWGVGSNEFYFHRHPSNHFSCLVNGPSGQFAVGSDAVSNNAWYHVIFWHDALNNQIGMVVNGGGVYGTPVTTAFSGGVFAVTSIPFSIGGTSSAGDAWNGLIEEIGFWKRVLTPAERVELYNAGAGKTYPFAAGGGLIAATGGTVTTDGNFKVHTFTADGTFTVTAGSGAAQVLVVAGGGAGGGAVAGAFGPGGGGGGGVVYNAAFSLATQGYSVVVGVGGAGGGTGDTGNAGSASSFASLSASGGGGGGRAISSGFTGGTGGSGGGGSGIGVGGAAVSGNNGGAGNLNGPNYCGGGGGGGGAVGANGTGAAGGNGGAGYSSSISGTSVAYAGGGGGGTYQGGTAGAGGIGGGGAGRVSAGNGTAGAANTGGGGGGAGCNGGGGSGGSGGSGVVIIRYQFQ